MTSVGLVLGAGGLVGGAYHAGALAALAESTGWDPRSADLIVGTSAGAATAASLRAGLSAPDQRARMTGRELSPAGAELVAGRPDPFQPGEDEPAPTSRGLLSYVPEAPWLVAPAILRPGPTRWGVALAGLVPAGRRSTIGLGDRVRATATGRWPSEPTWVVAYRTRDGRRVVFGRDDVEVDDLGVAVEASAAVPGRFRPVVMASGRYLDGAVHSPSNADLVAGLAYDLVIVSSPMTASPDALGDARSLPARTRSWFGRLLAREVEAIRKRDTAVLVLEPGAADMSAIGADLPDAELAPLVAETAYATVSARLADSEVAELTEGLRPGS
jgi:NTE family protein